ncbi:MAG: hypothetical protein AAFY31_18150 [Pseudomonadota bacterium]
MTMIAGAGRLMAGLLARMAERGIGHAVLTSESVIAGLAGS